MRRTFLASFVALFLCGAASAQAPVPPFAVVDFGKAILEYKKHAEMNSKLEQELEAVKASVHRERQRIAALKEGLDLFIEGSRERLDQEKKIRLAEIEVDLNTKLAAYEIQGRIAENLKKVYGDVADTAKKIAEERGIKLVISYNGNPITAKTEEGVKNAIITRAVLYADPSIDLTAEVVARLNK
ncbi:MAG TPA: OmpH family outer membrane protein [Planctomycetota bacterium]|nr:OmpH family outer membrane protein [Planctomycetota bacterium]